MEQNNNNDGWHEWSKHVLYQLEKANSDREKLQNDIKKLQEETLTMKIQAGMIATGASLVIGLVEWFMNFHK